MRSHTKIRELKRGFTLMEVLLVITTIALLFIALLVSVRKQRSRAEDARVKNDLELLKIAFEGYYNDNNCYPPQTWFNEPSDCNSTYLQPYMQNIPCDKRTNRPYVLEYAPTQCSGFRLYARLQNTDDPAVQRLKDPAGSGLGNYGVSSANTTVRVNLDIEEEQVVTGYYCSSVGNCTEFDSNEWDCTPSYSDSNCTGSGPSLCTTTGSCVRK